MLIIWTRDYLQTLDDFMYTGNETGFLAHRFYLFSVPIVYDYRDCDIGASSGAESPSKASFKGYSCSAKSVSKGNFRLWANAINDSLERQPNSQHPL